MYNHKDFKVKTKLQKLYLKAFNPNAYKRYKNDLHLFYELSEIERRDSEVRAFVNSTVLFTKENLLELSKINRSLNFIHSGNSGDIIYALPTLKRISELVDAPINLFLKLDQPLLLPAHFKHPLGNVMLNTKMANMLSPLIQSQHYINTCEIHKEQRIDIELDNFRKIPIYQGDIARWPSYTLGCSPEPFKSWIKVKPNLSYSNTIILARSERYRNSLINYSFLKQYADLVFVGVLSEYEDIKKVIPNIKWLQVIDFMELAQHIAGCKLFIGNQSFPYSIAEGLKVSRLLEQSFEVSNVIPSGEGGSDFFFQEHLESMVREKAKAELAQ